MKGQSEHGWRIAGTLALAHRAHACRRRARTAAGQHGVHRRARGAHVVAGRAGSEPAARLDRLRVPRARVQGLLVAALRARPGDRPRPDREAHRAVRGRLGARLDSAAVLSRAGRQRCRSGRHLQSAAQFLLDQHRQRPRRTDDGCAGHHGGDELPGRHADVRDARDQRSPGRIRATPCSRASRSSTSSASTRTPNGRARRARSRS